MWRTQTVTAKGPSSRRFLFVVGADPLSRWSSNGHGDSESDVAVDSVPSDNGDPARDVDHPYLHHLPTRSEPRSDFIFRAEQIQAVVVPGNVTTTLAVDVEQVYGCPANQTQSYKCPDGTGDDDGTVDGSLNCPVGTEDGYQGL